MLAVPHHVPPSPAVPCATSWMQPAMTGSRRMVGRRSQSAVRGVSGAGAGARGVPTACSRSCSAPQILQTTRRRAWHPTCGSLSSLWRRWSAPGGESCSGEAVSARQGCSRLGDPERGGHPGSEKLLFFFCKTSRFSSSQTFKETSEASLPGAAVAAPVLAAGPPRDRLPSPPPPPLPLPAAGVLVPWSREPDSQGPNRASSPPRSPWAPRGPFPRFVPFVRKDH